MLSIALKQKSFTGDHNGSLNFYSSRISLATEKGIGCICGELHLVLKLVSSNCQSGKTTVIRSSEMAYEWDVSTSAFI